MKYIYLYVWVHCSYMYVAVESLLKHLIGIIEACKVLLSKPGKYKCTNMHEALHATRLLIPIGKFNEWKIIQKHLASKFQEAYIKTAMLY